MKSYNETINSVFDKISEYKKKQKAKRNVAIKSAISVCCVLAVVLVGAWAWLGTDSGSHTYTDPDSTSNFIFEEQNQNYVVFNEISGKVPDISGIALMVNDFVPMSKEELIEYYGADVFLNCPDTFIESNNGMGIYKRNNGVGDVYYDTNNIVYTSTDNTKKVVIGVTKRRMLVEMTDDANAFFAELYSGTDSVINDVKILISEVKSENYYYAEFYHNGLTLTIWSENVTQGEFLTIIYSLTYSLAK